MDGPLAPPPRLSICVATFRRARFIGETLDSILAQLTPEVEIVVVDGASPDDTEAVVTARAAAHPFLRYRREPVNSGVDADYDKAVALARGEYCWLLPDDDLLAPGAIARVLDALRDEPDVLVVNTECRTPDFSTVLDASSLKAADERVYGAHEWEEFFSQAATHLAYIGGTIIRRSTWLRRERERYYGSLFVHVGVLFQQPPLASAKVIREPLVWIRYGNSMWSPRSFEIWMFLWPQMIWAFPGYSDLAKKAVAPREPWRNVRLLGLHRALGGYTRETYRKLIAGRAGWGFRTVAGAIACVPVKAANLLVTAYCMTAGRWARCVLWDMAYGTRSTWLARRAARLRGL